MIDTDKYEGHTPAPWEWGSYEHTQYEADPHPDKLLKKDAPLLLEEVKRLRSGMQDILDDFETTKTDMWSIIKRIQELIE